MKIVNIKQVEGKKSIVRDSYVGDGYVKAKHGSLPDVDLDFQADRRPEIKTYLEQRYNKAGMQRVFSAGTFTTIKIKTAIKDICRVHRVSVGTANYITSIVEKDNMTWTDFMRLAAKDKRVRDFVEKNPEVFEEIVPLMEQTRSAGIHASAVIVTPEYVKNKKVDCFDLLPIRKMDGMLVSELSGYDADALGILKNDVLAIQELTRLSDMLHLIKSYYKSDYTTLDIVINHANDPKVLKTISEGNTQGVFQMSGDGITRFIRRMQPEDIKDLIALVALFRPGPLDTGAADRYCDVKNLGIEPEYLWGTYEILKNTYGQIVYQEQIAQLAQKIGGLSLGDGVNLVKAISKKKIEKVNKFKDKFFKGAKANGCPDEAAKEIWDSAEKFASYAFNHCVAGHESFYGRNNHVGKCGVKFLTIRDMYQSLNDRAYAREHNRIPIRSLYQSKGYGKTWSMCSDGRARPNKIKDIRYAGIAPVFRITLENGRTLDVTENHRHPTNHGLKMTNELVVGEDEMYCIAGYEKAHYKMGRVKRSEKGLWITTSKVKSIKFIGLEDTYDVEMEAPNHTFANGSGIITHNSHATAYGLTAYVGAWIKTYYPMPFYSVVLRDVKEEKLPKVMSEIRQFGQVELCQPDINISGRDFMPDYKNNKIYWSLARIKFVGLAAVDYIVRERNNYGDFISMEEFIRRIFRNKLDKSKKKKETDEEATLKNPVNTRMVKHFIYSGVFDTLEGIKKPHERYSLMQKAQELLGLNIDENEIPADKIDKDYFWTQKQVALSGFSSVDYRAIWTAQGVATSNKWLDFVDLNGSPVEKKTMVTAATIVEVHDKTYKSKQDGSVKHFGKILLQQNTETTECILWSEAWSEKQDLFIGHENSIIAATVMVKYSDYNEKNELQINKGAYTALVE